MNQALLHIFFYTKISFDVSFHTLAAFGFCSISYYCFYDQLASTFFRLRRQRRGEAIYVFVDAEIGSRTERVLGLWS